MSKFNMMDLLNNNSKDVVERKKDKSNKFKTIMININDLVPNEENFYSVNREDLIDLKNSIEMFGIQQNLVVRKLENGKYEILTGHRRYLAGKELYEEGKEQFEYLPCKVENETDSIRDQLILIITNSTTRELSDWEKIKQAEKLRELLTEYKKKEKLTGRVREIIADILNTSSTQVARMESISKNLTDDFKEELKDDKVNFSSAYELSKLPEEEQKEAYEEYRDKGNISIKDVKEKQKSKEAEKKENVSDSDTKEVIVVDKDTGEIVEQKVPDYLNKTILNIIQKMTLDEMADFICSRCNGGNGCAGFCDLAIQCTKENRHATCVQWLSTQTMR